MDMCTDMCTNMCTDICIRMCTDMRIDMCIDTCIHKCIGVRTGMHEDMPHRHHVRESLIAKCSMARSRMSQASRLRVPSRRKTVSSRPRRSARSSSTSPAVCLSWVDLNVGNDTKKGWRCKIRQRPKCRHESGLVVPCKQVPTDLSANSQCQCRNLCSS